jgi:NADPH:quinone reductase-like Zn-dependent oxidoreductase
VAKESSVKAAVLHEVGGIPRYEDFPDPVAGEGEIVIDVKAVAVENVDKMIVAGHHFASDRYVAQLPVIPCIDGVGTLPDGTLVGFDNTTVPYGALADKAVVAASNVAPVPEGIAPAEAVVLTSALPAMSITSAAGFVPGETVLIQGATGVAGRLAVQVTRLLGAGRIVATGRDDDALQDVVALGADAVINTEVTGAHLERAFMEAKGEGYDVVLDFCWGRPTEILLRTLVPGAFTSTKPTRLIQVGEAAGPVITLAAESLRTSGVEIYGVARGLNQAMINNAYDQVVQWARNGALTFDIEKMPLSQIEKAWQRTDLGGKRLVIIP